MSGPLNGIRVLDLTQIYQGPYAAFLMAMAGAEVIKVESPARGDRLRGRGGSHTPLSFAMLNSNKKAVSLDIRKTRGRELLLKLVERSDVLLENFAPGRLNALDLGWDKLKSVNPRLIYVSGTGYGLSGPDRDLLAMDHTIQAAVGLMSVTGDDDRPPSRSGGAPCDLMGGVHMYAGALAALNGRHATGAGSLVEVSMLEAMYFTLASELTEYHRTGNLPRRYSGRSPGVATPYGRYRCRDGWITLICVSEVQWQSILETIGRADQVGNARYANALLRRDREHEVDAMIEQWTRMVTRDVAYERFRDARVPVAPIRDIEEVYNDRHLHERHSLQRFQHPDLGPINLPASPIRFSEYDFAEIGFYPQVGEHNREVYCDFLGLSASELETLVEEKVV